MGAASGAGAEVSSKSPLKRKKTNSSEPIHCRQRTRSNSYFLGGGESLNLSLDFDLLLLDLDLVRRLEKIYQSRMVEINPKLK